MSQNRPPLKSRPAQSNVLSRIQSYWPSPPASKTASPTVPSAQIVKPQARPFKVKIVTWNMHDSLPKGDLVELLGKVPSYSPPHITCDQFPEFSDDGDHPYHLVVVAGQECPTLSGIPMGLGAGFKWHDRDKDKLKEKEKEKEKDKDKDKDKEKEKEKEREGERAKLRRDKEEAKRRKEDEVLREHDQNGWTALCEDWLCNGGVRNNATSPTVADVSAPKPLVRRTPSKEPKKGPYQFLVKERLMGIYMAIYIHRDVRNLVKGMSKSAVTAGLIGGRVGNKGGVGISLNIDGTTFLFLNAHLAAHGSRVNHRLANLAKIKAELTVDAFLSSDDQKVMAEDLTDKFDHTFIFGDLNFRLDVTRLHADWLIAHKEYAKALHFDQLKKIMERGQEFVGFEEGSIDFPPTFKYDVLRTLKKAKRHSSRRGPISPAESSAYTSQEQLDQLIHGRADNHDEDALSITSTASRSSSLNSVDDQDACAISVNPISPTETSAPLSRTKQRVTKRWKSLLSVTRLHSRLRHRKNTISVQLTTPSYKSLEETQRPDMLRVQTAPLQRHSLDMTSTNNQTLLPPTIMINSTKTSLNSEEQEILDKGVYDSSHKQRVPSWCDRILWKTTVQPPPEEVEETGNTSMRSKAGLVQLLVRAFRPRSRSGSQASIPSSLTRTNQEATPATSVHPGPVPFSRIVQPAGLGTLGHTRSHENLRSQQPSGFGLTRRGSKTLLRRTSSAVPGPGRPDRRTTDSQNASRPGSRGGVWGFLPSFFSPTQSPEASAVELVPPVQVERKPRKGDVVCLSYRTLDDQGMRRLEGRSDHRPVVGSYAVYL